MIANKRKVLLYKWDFFITVFIGGGAIVKRYRYFTPDNENGVVVVEKTEDEILTEYWEYWYNQMKAAIKRPNCAAYGKPDLINKDNCITDWIIINWAEEIKQYDGVSNE